VEDMLEVEDVCRILGLSEYTVWNMLRSGELAGHKVRGRWRVWPHDLAAYIDDCRVNVTPILADTGHVIPPRPKNAPPPGSARAAIRASRNKAA
jgi:excisionase family DNA binding protein